MTDNCGTEESLNYFSHLKGRFKAVLSDIDLCEEISRFYRDDAKAVAESINKLLSDSEIAFLQSKNAMKYYPQKEFTERAPETGRWFVEKTDDGYRFVLPSLVSKHNKNKAGADGKAVRSLVEKLCSEMKLFSPYDYAEISIVFHIGRIGRKDPAPDYDNVDLKSMLDALQGKLIKNDSVLDYRLYASGVADVESYTEMYVRRGQKYC